MDEPYRIGFIAEETPSPRDLYNQCRQLGLRTSYEGESETIAQYRIGITAYTDERPEDASDALEQAEKGSIRFWTDAGVRLNVGFAFPTNEDEARLGRASISFQTSDINWRSLEDTVYQSRLAELLELVGGLVYVVDPTYVWSGISRGYESLEPIMPEGRPTPANIERLSWVTVMSEPVIAAFGGREHVLATPAWEVRELDTGHIMLVLEDHLHDPKQPIDGSPEEHLLQ